MNDIEIFAKLIKKQAEFEDNETRKEAFNETANKLEQKEKEQKEKGKDRLSHS